MYVGVMQHGAVALQPCAARYHKMQTNMQGLVRGGGWKSGKVSEEIVLTLNIGHHNKMEVE